MLPSGIGAALAILLVGAQFVAAQQFPSLVPNLQLFYFGIPAVIAGAFFRAVGVAQSAALRSKFS